MKHHQHKVEAIILHADDIFDADRLYLLFSREEGKVRARARGVRRPKSRLAGNLLPYVPTSLELVSGENGWQLIVQAHASAAGGFPQASLPFLQHAELVAEAIDKLLPDLEPHPDIFNGLSYTLQRLRYQCEQETPSSPQLLLIVTEYLFKLLIVMGYHPELTQCVITGEKLAPQGLAWSSQVGGAVSEEGMHRMSVPSFPIHAKTVVVLRQLANAEFTAERLHMDPEVQLEACRVVFDYLQTQIGKPLKSYSVLGQI